MNRTKPSFHLLLLAIIFLITAAGYTAVIWSAGLKGYNPSLLITVRALIFFVPLAGILIWLRRRHKFRGELILFTAAVLLFSLGSVMQYRLFSDPEYGARGEERLRARELKTQTVRLRNISTGYDDKKKQFLFGGADAAPERPLTRFEFTQTTLGTVLTSVNTYIPLAAFAALALGFLVFKRDKTLLWLQKHSITIGLATLAPFAVIVLLFSDEGKFLGRTTPWEPVKIVFLISFAGVLTESYRKLSRTRWGLPPLRWLLPSLIIATMPIVPFFALSDFGQMLVFFGVYSILYFVAVAKKSQLLYAALLVGVVFGAFFVTSKVSTGAGVPSRIYQRFHMWTNTWEPPSVDVWWWKRDFERFLKSNQIQLDPNDPEEIKRYNAEAWSDRVLQVSQGLLGLEQGGLAGKGYGLGYPETVPISDSDFIYSAMAEELGLLGSIIIVAGILVFALGGSTISVSSPDMFTKLIAAGLTAFIGLQSIVNIGGVLRVLPMTGITLPFVSHGGWSLITSFGMLGILLAISHKNAGNALRSDDN